MQLFPWPRDGALAGGGEQVRGGGRGVGEERMRPGLPQRERCAKENCAGRRVRSPALGSLISQFQQRTSRAKRKVNV